MGSDDGEVQSGGEEARYEAIIEFDCAWVVMGE